MNDTIICVLYACTCGHMEADHDGPVGNCQAFIEVDTKDDMLICECDGFTVAGPEA